VARSSHRRNRKSARVLVLKNIAVLLAALHVNLRCDCGGLALNRALALQRHRRGDGSPKMWLNYG
jgi:hypothetical protein